MGLIFFAKYENLGQNIGEYSNNVCKKRVQKILNEIRRENIALLAIQFLALKDKDLATKLENYRQEMREKIKRDNNEIQQ